MSVTAGESSFHSDRSTLLDTGQPAAAAQLPLVLLHGLTDSAQAWPSVVRHCSGQRRVIALNARGHGGAPLPDEPFTVQALADDAARKLRELTLGPAVVLGHSMGGATAQALALSDPDLVAALVLEDPAWVELPDGEQPEWLVSVIRELAGRPVDELRGRARDWVGGWPADDQAAWIEAIHSLNPRLLAVEHRWSQRDWVDAMAGIIVPVTLLTGDPGAGVVTEAMVTRVAARLGLAPAGLLTHEPISGVGHNIRREDPTAFLAVLDAALARADEFAAEP